MDCKTFQELITDFIFDKIEYSDDLEEFLHHAKECKNCNDELELYYTIHRGLGDAPAPIENNEMMSFEDELNNIFSFYDEHFEKKHFLNKAGKISIIVFIAMIICTGIYIYARQKGYI